jgi:hypothetical protein
MSLGKKFYCTFVDFSKAFDTITRSSLWVKLQKSNITGKVFRIIHSLYDNVKSCIKNNDKFSSFFRCDIGVRQGENLSPFLFAIYQNNLEQFFVENDVNDLENIRNMCSENLNIFVKLFSLLYADDTIILSETEADMQYALAIFEKYCHHWKLKVNLQKTKVIIFCKRK